MPRCEPVKASLNNCETDSRRDVNNPSFNDAFATPWRKGGYQWFRKESGGVHIAPLPAMIRVVVADDHAMFREMLNIALPRGGNIEVVGEAENGRELSNVLYRTRADVLLLDYKMPQVSNFLGLVQQLRKDYSTTNIVVLSGFASAEIATRAAEGGARGYVLKCTRLAAVGDAIRAVAAGGIWIDPGLPRKIFDIFQRHSSGPLAGGEGDSGLTRREREVLACVAEGVSNQTIALKLCISEQTVKTHLTRVFAKLGVKNRLAAALAYYGKGNGATRTSLASNP